MDGGNKKVTLGVTFRQKFNGEFLPNLVSCETEFYEASMEVDAILSFPWMSQNHIGVFPHHKALAIDEPYFALLYGWTGERKQKRKRCGKDQRRRVRMIREEEPQRSGIPTQ
eukprot:EG_transcript_50312